MTPLQNVHEPDAISSFSDDIGLVTTAKAASGLHHRVWAARPGSHVPCARAERRPPIHRHKVLHASFHACPSPTTPLPAPRPAPNTRSILYTRRLDCESSRS